MIQISLDSKIWIWNCLWNIDRGTSESKTTSSRNRTRLRVTMSLADMTSSHSGKAELPLPVYACVFRRALHFWSVPVGCSIPWKFFRREPILRKRVHKWHVATKAFDLVLRGYTSSFYWKSSISVANIF